MIIGWLVQQLCRLKCFNTKEYSAEVSVDAHTYQFKPSALAATSIGVARITLDKLASTCELHQMIPLAHPENERKPTGFKIEARIRVNTPIEKVETVEEKFTWAIMMVSVVRYILCATLYCVTDRFINLRFSQRRPKIKFIKVMSMLPSIRAKTSPTPWQSLNRYGGNAMFSSLTMKWLCYRLQQHLLIR